MVASEVEAQLVEVIGNKGVQRAPRDGGLASVAGVLMACGAVTSSRWGAGFETGFPG